jgi:malate dehydrogenase
MERKDVMTKNVTIYRDQASALGKHASKDVKVLVVANPANTNALILKEYAPEIAPENISCLTRLDHNRAMAQASERGRQCGDLLSSLRDEVVHLLSGIKILRYVLGCSIACLVE